MTINVLYSCIGCGIVKRSVTVPARQHEDVKHWLLNICMEVVGRDHSAQSPNCDSGICDLMIPVTGSDKIGGPSVN